MAVISAKDQLVALFNAANSGLPSPLTAADQAEWDTDEEVLAFVNAELFGDGETEDPFALSELTITREDGSSGEKIITVKVKEGHIKYQPASLAVYTVTQPIVKTDLSTTNGELGGFGGEGHAGM